MGKALPPYYGKSKFYENKRTKLVKKVNKIKAEIKICEDKIAELKD